jgi:hypothetical protein
MVRRMAVASVAVSLMAGCSCQSNATDGGIARDAAPPCEGPVRVERYDLSPAFGEYRSAQLGWVADLGDRELASFYVSRDGIDPLFGTPTTVSEAVLALTTPEHVWVPIEPPVGLAEDSLGEPIDLGDRILFRPGDGTAHSYSAAGWAEEADVVVPDWDRLSLVSCDAPRIIGLVHRPSADGLSVAYGVAVVEFSLGAGRVLEIVPFDAAPGAPTVLTCAVDDEGTGYAVVQWYEERYTPTYVVEGTSPPRLVVVSPDDVMSVTTLGSEPIVAAAFHGRELMMLVGQPDVRGVEAQVWDLGSLRLLASRSVALPTRVGPGSVLSTERGTLFVFKAEPLFGLLWDGRAIAAPWELPVDGNLSTGGRWWATFLDPYLRDGRPAAIRFCEGE